jgi:hypothetical protein
MAKKSFVFPVLALGGVAAAVIYYLTGSKLQKLEIAFKAFQKNINFGRNHQSQYKGGIT